MEHLLPGLSAIPNIHPLKVHFPLALWPAALLFWLLALLRENDDLWRAGRWLLYLGAADAVVAVATGLWAAEQMGHDSPGHDLVHTHRNFMFVAAGLGLALAAFAWRKPALTPRARWGLFAWLLAVVVLLALGADRGALLVYRHAIGTRVEPAVRVENHEH